MKVSQNILLGAAAALVLAAAPSCSLFKDSSNKVAGSSGQVTAQRTTESKPAGKTLTPPKNAGSKSATANTEEPKGVKNKNNKGRGETAAKPSKGKTPVVPGQADNRRPLTDSNAPATTEKRPAYNPNLDKDFTINGEWTIYSVRGNVVTGEERPYLTFDLPAKRFYGNNGCNYINGDLVLGENGAIRLDNMISTMRLCNDAEFEYLINLATSDVRSYSARVEGPITFLDLLDGKSTQPILVLRRHNMDFLNGAWKVDTLNGTPLVTEDGEPASLTFNITDLQIHGTTGCNRLNGKLFIDPDKKNSLQIVNVATTRMMCSPESRETEFLLALESVESARQTGSDTITLTSPDGTELFTLTRIPIATDE